MATHNLKISPYLILTYAITEHITLLLLLFSLQNTFFFPAKHAHPIVCYKLLQKVCVAFHSMKYNNIFHSTPTHVHRAIVENFH